MRRPQFSLRTALIGMTLLAMPLAWFARELRESSRQCAIAKRLEEAGAMVRHEGEFLPHVTGVYFSQGNVDDAIELLAGLPDLTELTMQFSDFSNEQLRHLIGLEHLESVDLKWTPISDQGLAYLARVPSIRSLKLNKLYPPKQVANVSKSQLTDHALKHISKMRNLEKLIIWGADISDRGLSDIAKCERLKTLWLLDTGINGEGLKHLSTLPELEKLDLSGTRVTASSLEPLKAMRSLNSLSIARTQVSKQEALEYYASRQGTFSIGY